MISGQDSPNTAYYMPISVLCVQQKLKQPDNLTQPNCSSKDLQRKLPIECCQHLLLSTVVLAILHAWNISPHKGPSSPNWMNYHSHPVENWMHHAYARSIWVCNLQLAPSGNPLAEIPPIMGVQSEWVQCCPKKSIFWKIPQHLETIV